MMVIGRDDKLVVRRYVFVRHGTSTLNRSIGHMICQHAFAWRLAFVNVIKVVPVAIARRGASRQHSGMLVITCVSARRDYF